MTDKKPEDTVSLAFSRCKDWTGFGWREEIWI